MDSTIKLRIKAEDDGSASLLQRLTGKLHDVANSSLDTTRATKALENAQKSLRTKIEENINRIGHFARNLNEVASGIQAGIQKIIAPITSGASFEAAMDEVTAISGIKIDTTEGQQAIAELTETARELGATTKFSASEAAAGLKYLSLAGMEASDSIAAMPGLLDLAAATNADLAFSADLVSDQLSALGMAAHEAGKLADIFAATTTSANTDLLQLAEAAKYAAGNFAGVGWTATDLATAIAKMADNGLKASMAGTAARSAINSLAAPTSKAKDLMKELGFSALDASGKFKDMPTMFKDLNRAMESMSDPERIAAITKIFGVEASTGIGYLLKNSQLLTDEMGKQTTQLERYKRSLKSAGGTAARMANIMTDNLAGDWKTLNSSLSELGLSIYDYVRKPLRNMVQFATSATRSVTSFVQQAGSAFDFFREKATNAFAFLQNFDFTGSGIALLDSLASGIQQKANTLYQIFKNVLQKARNLLPFSEPKDSSSPLAGLKKSGTAIIDMIYSGVIQVKDRIVGAFREIFGNVIAYISAQFLALPSYAQLGLGALLLIASSRIMALLTAVGSLGSALAGFSSIVLTAITSWKAYVTILVSYLTVTGKITLNIKDLTNILTWMLDVLTTIFQYALKIIQDVANSSTSLKVGILAIGVSLLVLFSRLKGAFLDIFHPDFAKKTFHAIQNQTQALCDKSRYCVTTTANAWENFKTKASTTIDATKGMFKRMFDYVAQSMAVMANPITGAAKRDDQAAINREAAIIMAQRAAMQGGRPGDYRSEAMREANRKARQEITQTQQIVGSAANAMLAAWTVAWAKMATLASNALIAINSYIKKSAFLTNVVTIATGLWRATVLAVNKAYFMVVGTIHTVIGMTKMLMFLNPLATTIATAVAFAATAILVVQNWKVVWQTMSQWVAGFTNILQSLGAIIQNVFSTYIGGYISSSIANLLNAIVQLLVDVASTFGLVAESAFLALSGQFYEAGQKLIEALGKGLTSAWTFLRDAFLSVLEFFGLYLPHSDAQQGELSHLTASGEAIPGTLAAGIEKGSAMMQQATDFMMNTTMSGFNQKLEEWKAWGREKFEEVYAYIFGPVEGQLTAGNNWLESWRESVSDWIAQALGDESYQKTFIDPKKEEEAAKQAAIQNENAWKNHASNMQKLAADLVQNRIDYGKKALAEIKSQLSSAQTAYKEYAEKAKELEESIVDEKRRQNLDIREMERANMDSMEAYSDKERELSELDAQFQIAMQQRAFEEAERLARRREEVAKSMAGMTAEMKTGGVNAVTGKEAVIELLSAEESRRAALEETKKSYEMINQAMAGAGSLADTEADRIGTLRKKLDGIKSTMDALQKTQVELKIEVQDPTEALQKLQDKLKQIDNTFEVDLSAIYQEKLANVTKQNAGAGNIEQKEQLKAAIAEAENYKQKITELNDKLLSVQGVNITPDTEPAKQGIQAVKNEINELQDKTVTVTVQKQSVEGHAGGGVVSLPGFARGGKLPGFSLTDNIVARLERGGNVMLAGGEYIVNALRTRLAQPLLDFVNFAPLEKVREVLGLVAIQRFAQGGFIKPLPPIPVLHRNIGGNIPFSVSPQQQRPSQTVRHVFTINGREAVVDGASEQLNKLANLVAEELQRI